MRRALAVAVPVLLGCAGLLEPKLASRSYGALSIDMLDGRATEDFDHGLEGNYRVEWMSVTQELDWDPLDPDWDAEVQARSLWDSWQRIVATMDGAPAFATTDIAFEHHPLDGQDAVTFEAMLGQELILATVWACPGSGVEVSLSTTGDPGWTRQAHDDAVATMRCGTEPVTLAAAALTWRFTGDPRRWTPQEAEPGQGRWERTDGEVVLVVSSQGTLLDAELPDLCLTTMRKIHDNLLDTYTFDETKTTFGALAGGCAHGWEGTHADGSYVKGRFEWVECAGARGYLLTCMVYGDGDPAHACRDAVACASP